MPHQLSLLKDAVYVRIMVMIGDGAAAEDNLYYAVKVPRDEHVVEHSRIISRVLFTRLCDYNWMDHVVY